MNSIIGWVGGKKALRNDIIDNFPKENAKTYCEVFGGAGWVLFAKPIIKGQKEVYNDFNGQLVNLFRCLKYHYEAVQKELDYMMPSSEIFDNFKNELSSQQLTDIQRAARFFYIAKTSFQCQQQKFATYPRRLDIAINRFKQIQERLTNVVIENRDFEKTIKLYDTEGTLFYLDPPYHGTEKYYDVGFTDADHLRLKSCLEKIKGKFILSYNDDEFIRDLYKDFTILEVSRANTLSLTARDKAKYKELIIKNY